MNLTIIELRGKRVLTTAQLGAQYETSSDKISYNFNYNKERYKEGKHFILLQGEELKAFKDANREFQGSLNKLYLWTERGAWLHAKSLNTDRAWEAYELLLDEYYKVIEQPQFSNLELALQAALKHEQDIKEVKSDISLLKDTMRIDSLQQQEIQQAARKVVVQALGGKNSGAYKEIGRKAFIAFWYEFKCYFNIPRYPDLPKIKQGEALDFIRLWRPSTSLQMEIDTFNRQSRAHG